MKKILCLILCEVLLVACGGNKENTTQQGGSSDTTKKPVDTGSEAKSGWKWDLLVENSEIQLGETNLYHGQPLYDRRDSLSYAFLGKEMTEGKYNASYVVVRANLKDEKFQAISLEEVETKYLVKENNVLGSHFFGLFKGNRLQWNIKEREKIIINGIEFLHLVADIEAFINIESNTKSSLYKKGVSTHAEGYFAMADKVDGSGKQLIVIIRGWTSDSSEEVQEKTKKVVNQVLENLQIKK